MVPCTLGTWGIPHSRDRQLKTHIIDRARTASNKQGHTVTLDIDNTHRDTATASRPRLVANKTVPTRLFDAKQHAATTRPTPHGNATTTPPPHSRRSASSSTSATSERRHRNALDKAWNSIGTAVHAQNDADEAERRAHVASRTTEHRYNPVIVANRIDKLEAEQRAIQRRLIATPAPSPTSPGGQETHEETTTAATGDYRQAITERMAQRADDIADGTIRADDRRRPHRRLQSRDTIAKGDQIKIRFHGWVPVVRANPKTVSVETPAPYGGRLIRRTIPYPEIQDHRPHSDNSDTTTDTP